MLRMRDDALPARQYRRIQATYRGRLGVEVGLFVAVDHLRRAGQLTPAEEQLYFDIDDWFDERLPHPPFYEDGNSIGAVTWFRASLPETMTLRISQMRVILDLHGVQHEQVWSNNPGQLVYADEFQVGVIPQVRHDPTPMPEGLTLGPTAAGSKRALARPRLDPPA